MRTIEDRLRTFRFMKRWKSLLANHWRSKLVCLALAALFWLLLRPRLPASFGAPPTTVPPPAAQG